MSAKETRQVWQQWLDLVFDAVMIMTLFTFAAGSIYIAWALDQLGEWNDFTVMAFLAGFMAVVGGLGLSGLFWKVIDHVR